MLVVWKNIRLCSQEIIHGRNMKWTLKCLIVAHVRKHLQPISSQESNHEIERERKHWSWAWTQSWFQKLMWMNNSLNLKDSKRPLKMNVRPKLIPAIEKWMKKTLNEFGKVQENIEGELEHEAKISFKRWMINEKLQWIWYGPRDHWRWKWTGRQSKSSFRNHRQRIKFSELDKVQEIFEDELEQKTKAVSQIDESIEKNLWWIDKAQEIIELKMNIKQKQFQKPLSKNKRQWTWPSLSDIRKWAWT